MNPLHLLSVTASQGTKMESVSQCKHSLFYPSVYLCSLHCRVFIVHLLLLLVLVRRAHFPLVGTGLDALIKWLFAYNMPATSLSFRALQPPLFRFIFRSRWRAIGDDFSCRSGENTTSSVDIQGSWQALATCLRSSCELQCVCNRLSKYNK